MIGSPVPIFNPAQRTGFTPPDRADRYRTQQGVEMSAPLRVVVDTLAATVAEAVSDQSEQLDALGGGVFPPEQWELASWSAVPEPGDPEGRWRFTAHYVWAPRLSTTGADS